eukprot:1625537-Prymnesium_polylepis.1
MDAGVMRRHLSVCPHWAAHAMRATTRARAALPACVLTSLPSYRRNKSGALNGSGGGGPLEDPSGGAEAHDAARGAVEREWGRALSSPLGCQDAMR